VIFHVCQEHVVHMSSMCITLQAEHLQLWPACAVGKTGCQLGRAACGRIRTPRAGMRSRVTTCAPACGARVRLCGGAQVFWVSRGKVKPANRQYSAVRNDYTINLDNGCGPPHPDLDL